MTLHASLLPEDSHHYSPIVGSPYEVSKCAGVGCFSESAQRTLLHRIETIQLSSSASWNYWLASFPLIYYLCSLCAELTRSLMAQFHLFQTPSAPKTKPGCDGFPLWPTNIHPFLTLHPYPLILHPRLILPGPWYSSNSQDYFANLSKYMYLANSQNRRARKSKKKRVRRWWEF